MGSDFAAFYMGMKQFLLEEVWQHHRIPLWNPFVFSGIPFWAHFESTIFYPLDILFWFLPPERAYGLTMCLHLVLAAFFLFLLARSLGMGHAASFVSSMVYGFNGYIIPTLSKGQMFRVQAYIWIPLILYFLHRASKAKRPYLHGAVAGLLWGFQILSGSPQDAFYTFFVAFLFLAFQNGFREKTKAARLGVLFLLFFLFGAGAAAIQVIPAFEFMGRSVRAALDDYSLMTMGSYPPEGIITTLMPHFYGNYLKWNFWVSNLPWSIPFYNLYVGLLPVVLLLFIGFADMKRDRILLFSMILAFLVFFLALGSHTPIYKLLFHLPGFDRIRAPGKIIVVWVLAWSLLAGRTMDLLRQRKGSSLMRRTAVAMIIGACLLILDVLFHWDRSLVLKVFSPFILKEAIPEKLPLAALHIRTQFHYFALGIVLIVLVLLLRVRGLLKQGAAAFLLCGLLVLDLGLANRGAMQLGDDTYQWTKKTKRSLAATIGQDRSVFRVGSYRYDMGANIEMYMGFQTVGGYNPLFLNRYYEYINRYLSGKRPVSKGWIVFFYEDSRHGILMDLLNLKYVISYRKKTFATRKSCLPRAFIVSGARTVKRDEVLEILTGDDFDPRQWVLIEEKPPGAPEEEKGGFQKSSGTAKILSYRPDEILIQADAAAPGYLFLSEIFYPGWKASVDGRPVTIMRGNYLFRVIPIPEGKHRIRVFYDPWSVKLGVGITLLTLMIMCIFLVLHLRNGKSRSKNKLGSSLENHP